MPVKAPTSRLAPSSRTALSTRLQARTRRSTHSRMLSLICKPSKAICKAFEMICQRSQASINPDHRGGAPRARRYRRADGTGLSGGAGANGRPRLYQPMSPLADYVEFIQDVVGGTVLAADLGVHGKARGAVDVRQRYPGCPRR